MSRDDIDGPDDRDDPEAWADVVEDAGLMDRLPVNRRKFLGLAHGFGGAAALSALAGCSGGDGGDGGSTTTTTSGDGGSTPTETQTQTQTTTQSGDMELVKVSTVPVNGTLPIYIGQAEGYFAERGIEVEVSSTASGSRATAQLATGQLDATAGATGASTMNAIAQGVGIKSVADRTRITPELPSTLEFQASSEVYEDGFDLSDAGGLTWATNVTASVGHHHVARALEAHGLSFDDITLETLPFPQMISALDSGAVDIIQEVGALNGAARANAGAKHVEYTGATSPNSQVAHLQFGEPFINQRRDVAVGFLEAYILGIRYMYDQGPFSDRVATIWEEATGQPPAILRGGTPAWASRNGQVNGESFVRQQEFHVCMGNQEEVIPASELVDDELREEALDNIGRVDESEEFVTPEEWEQWQSEVDTTFPAKGELNPPDATECGGAGPQ